MMIQGGLHEVKVDMNKDRQADCHGFNLCSGDGSELPWITKRCEETTNIGKKRSLDPTPKHSQITATLKWLSENYEKSDGVCLPRCVLYTHYLDFCKNCQFNPAGAATFGKIIRQRFPKLTTRRLGTRGQSKYHYYGIGIKESSVYYHSVYTGKGLTRFSGTKMKTEGCNKKYTLCSKTGTLLPDFPDINNLMLPSGLDRDKMKTFLMMYRTHCQRILDAIIGANFDEIENFLLHFWHGMPDHLLDILDNSLTTDIIALCDSILYKVLIDVLIPVHIQELPDSLTNEIKNLLKKIPVWIKIALEETPTNIHTVKETACRQFIQTVKRQMSFVHLAQTTRNVLSNTDTVKTIITDTNTINIQHIASQVIFLKQPIQYQHRRLILTTFREFQTLLENQSSIESYIEWMDELIDKCVLQNCKNENVDFNELRAAEFLLQWSMIGSLVMRDLTLHSASSFGSFHLLHMMLDEYAFMVLETQAARIRDTLLQSNVQQYMLKSEMIQMSPRLRSVSQNPTAKTRKRKLGTTTATGFKSTEQSYNNSKISDPNASRIQGNVAYIKPIPVVRAEEPPSCSSSNYNHNCVGYQPIPFDTPLSSARPCSSFNSSHFGGNNSYSNFNHNSHAFSAARVPAPHYQEPNSRGHSISLYSSLTRSHSPSCPWSDNRALPVVNGPISHYTYGCHGCENYKKTGYLSCSYYHEPANTSYINAPPNQNHMLDYYHQHHQQQYQHYQHHQQYQQHPHYQHHQQHHQHHQQNFHLSYSDTA